MNKTVICIQLEVMARDPLPPHRLAPTPTSSASSPPRTRSGRAKRHAGHRRRAPDGDGDEDDAFRDAPPPRALAMPPLHAFVYFAQPPQVPSSSCACAPPTAAPSAARRAARAPSPSTSRVHASRWEPLADGTCCLAFYRDAAFAFSVSAGPPPCCAATSSTSCPSLTSPRSWRSRTTARSSSGSQHITGWFWEQSHDPVKFAS